MNKIIKLSILKKYCKARQENYKTCFCFFFLSNKKAKNESTTTIKSFGSQKIEKI